MNIESLRDYCLSLKGATEDFPFDEDTLVFKVMGKMFALTSLKRWETGDHSINLKCDPEKVPELRESYQAVEPGYHMNKKHWNTVHTNRDAPDRLLKMWIDHSYDLVVSGLTKKQREALEKLS